MTVLMYPPAGIAVSAANEFGVPLLDLDAVTTDPEAIRVVSEKFGGETLFWLPVGLHILELVLMTTLPAEGTSTRSSAAAGPAPFPTATATPRPQLNPRPIAKVRAFLYLGWLANPFAYMAINGILPVNGAVLAVQCKMSAFNLRHALGKKYCSHIK